MRDFRFGGIAKRKNCRFQPGWAGSSFETHSASIARAVATAWRQRRLPKPNPIRFGFHEELVEDHLRWCAIEPVAADRAATLLRQIHRAIAEKLGRYSDRFGLLIAEFRFIAPIETRAAS